MTLETLALPRDARAGTLLNLVNVFPYGEPNGNKNFDVRKGEVHGREGTEATFKKLGCNIFATLLAFCQEFSPTAMEDTGIQEDTSLTMERTSGPMKSSAGVGITITIIGFLGTHVSEVTVEAWHAKGTTNDIDETMVMGDFVLEWAVLMKLIKVDATKITRISLLVRTIADAMTEMMMEMIGRADDVRVDLGDYAYAKNQQVHWIIVRTPHPKLKGPYVEHEVLRNIKSTQYDKSEETVDVPRACKELTEDQMLRSRAGPLLEATVPLSPPIPGQSTGTQARATTPVGGNSRRPWEAPRRSGGAQSKSRLDICFPVEGKYIMTETMCCGIEGSGTVTVPPVPRRLSQRARVRHPE